MSSGKCTKCFHFTHICNQRLILISENCFEVIHFAHFGKLTTTCLTCKSLRLNNKILRQKRHRLRNQNRVKYSLCYAYFSWETKWSTMNKSNLISFSVNDIYDRTEWLKRCVHRRISTSESRSLLLYLHAFYAQIKEWNRDTTFLSTNDSIKVWSQHRNISRGRPPLPVGDWSSRPIQFLAHNNYHIWIRDFNVLNSTA